MYLKKQYKTGPVENNSNQKTPYLEYLNAKLKKDTDDFWKAVTESNQKFDAWVGENFPRAFNSSFNQGGWS